MSILGTLRNGRWKDVLGMNARNAIVEGENPPDAIRLVNSKSATKEALEKVGVPYPKTLYTVEGRRELSQLDWDALPEGWVLKPNLGRRGAGILLASRRDPEGDGWLTGSGRRLTRAEILDHLRFVLDGEFSLENVPRDMAFFEELIKPHPTLARLVPSGLPDVRLVCYRNRMLLAMMRLPTFSSEGRANLHQGAIGAAVDLETGRVTRATAHHTFTEHHPDTGEKLVGLEVPEWGEILEIAKRCCKASKLRYSGVDIVVDEKRGPLVLEINARPGLEIQNISGVGLAAMIRSGEDDGQSEKHRP